MNTLDEMIDEAAAFASRMTLADLEHWHAIILERRSLARWRGDEDEAESLDLLITVWGTERRKRGIG